MNSRLRTSPDNLFECLCVVALPGYQLPEPAVDPFDDFRTNGFNATNPFAPPTQTAGLQVTEPFILKKYPPTFTDDDLLKDLPKFAYPCDTEHNSLVVHFSFVLTSLDSKWTFGYTRHAPHSKTCLVILSSLPWHETFYKILNHITELEKTEQEESVLNHFLESLYYTEIPQPCVDLCVVYSVRNKLKQFVAPCPDTTKLPTILDDRNLKEYYNAIDVNNMIEVFASMLNERRILITSSRLTRLSAVVQSANSLIYPMHWQHIFIPVLPTHLLDYLSAPMPFLIGVPTTTLEKVKRAEMGDVVLLDADSNKLTSPFDDVSLLPVSILKDLRTTLKSLSPQQVLTGDRLARAFLRALVTLIGGYREALTFPPGQRLTFDNDKFILTRPLPLRPFLERMLHLQIFRQFIDDRLAQLNRGEGFACDEFESEINAYEDKANSPRKKYLEWAGQMKRESGAFLRRAPNQMRKTVGAVRNAGRRAMADIRGKVADLSRQTSSGGSSNGSSGKNGYSTSNGISASVSATSFGTAIGTGNTKKGNQRIPDMSFGNDSSTTSLPNSLSMPTLVGLPSGDSSNKSSVVNPSKLKSNQKNGNNIKHIDIKVPPLPKPPPPHHHPPTAPVLSNGSADSHNSSNHSSRHSTNPFLHSFANANATSNGASRAINNTTTNHTHPTISNATPNANQIITSTVSSTTGAFDQPLIIFDYD